MNNNCAKLDAADRSRIFFNGRAFYVFDQVYKPDADTFLLAENLEVNPKDSVLELGTGCGLLGILSALKAEHVVAVDINPYAVTCTKLNAKINGVPDRVEVIRGDLCSSLRQDAFFDLILFNAPYLPVTEEEIRSWIDYAWSGGLKGREIIDRFITQTSDHLKPGGRVLLVQSTLSDVEQTLKEFQQRGFKATVIGEQKAEFETITLIQAELNDPYRRQS